MSSLFWRRVLFGMSYLLLTLTSPPPQKTVTAGSSVSVPCPLAAPGGSVQWLQDGKPVLLDPSATRWWKIAPDGTAALTIAETRTSDAGRWECQELGSDGSVRRVASVLDLVVASSPENPYLELEGRRLLHQATVTVKEPQKLSLHCVVSGAVPPVRRIHWTIGEANLTSMSELFVDFSGEAYTSRSVLTLNVTRRVHGEELVCRAQHATWLQMAATSASLNVLYEPSFSISRDPDFGMPLAEGMSAALRCEVDANPPSDPEWVRDDEPLTSPQETAGLLLFEPLTRRHAGWYRCTTRHEFGEFASFSYFLNIRDLPLSSSTTGDHLTTGQSLSAGCLPDGRPEVSAVNKSLNVVSGQSALLSGQLCSSVQPIQAFWILRHRVLRPGERHWPYVAHNLTEMDIPGCWMSGLQVLRLRVEDSGELLLVVKTSRGLADASFHLNVTPASSLASSTAPSDRPHGLVLFLFILVCVAQLRLNKMDAR